MLDTAHGIYDRATLAAADLPAYAGLPLAAITLIASDADAETAAAVLMAAKVIGFDSESKPTFLKGEVTTGPHLVQLATEEHAYLFQILPNQDSTALKAVLESAAVLKVGFGLGNDRRDLQARLDIKLHNVLDLGETLRSGGQLGQPDNERHRGTVGAKLAVAHFFGAKLQKSKKIGTSNWASRQLSERQLLYAANDAWVALQVYRAWRERQGAID